MAPPEGESLCKTLLFHTPWESRFSSNGNRSKFNFSQLFVALRTRDLHPSVDKDGHHSMHRWLIGCVRQNRSKSDRIANVLRARKVDVLIRCVTLEKIELKLEG